MKFQYQNDVSLARRREESLSVRTKYPDKVPVIVERLHGSDIPALDKNKFLVPSDVTVGQLQWLVRRRIKLRPEKAFHLYTDKTIPSSSSLMSEVYDEYKDDDGFLYISYSGENTYGQLL